MLFASAQVPDSKEALVDEAGSRVTYGDLARACSDFSAVFSPRTLFILVMDRSIEAISFYYALMSNDCVPLLLGEENNAAFIRRYAALYQPDYIWLPHAVKEALDLPGTPLWESDCHTLVKTGYPHVELHPDLGILLTTSGSTGNPKTVRLSKNNLRENALAYVDAVKMSGNERGVTTLPVNYTYGMAICHTHFISGSTLLITERKIIDPEFRFFIVREGVTNLQGVPFFHSMLDRVGFYEQLPQSLRFITMGGSRAEEKLQQKINRITEERGIRFYALYGQTEGTTILTKLPEGQNHNEPGCVGIPCYGMRACLGEDGELIFQGSSVCMGYADDRGSLLRGDDNEGILHTGDLAEIDSSGRIYLKGRKKRIVKVLGVRVSLDDIESFVNHRFQVACACAGADDDIHLYTEGELEPLSVRKAIAEQFGISALVISVESPGILPRNNKGKIEYAKLQ